MGSDDVRDVVLARNRNLLTVAERGLQVIEAVEIEASVGFGTEQKEGGNLDRAPRMPPGCGGVELAGQDGHGLE